MANYDDLKNLLSQMGGVVVGYSGGVDSTFLARAATDTLGEKAICVLIESCLVPESEIDDAVAIAADLGLNLIRLKVDALSIENVPDNNPDRCYHCKKSLFSNIVTIAKDHGLSYVLDGANASDESDYRPGTQATSELGVRSPLKELDITKEQVRAMARDLGLSIWNKPSYACLASRVPYGTRLTVDILKRIEKAEIFLQNQGFRQFRVRHHDNVARIELMQIEMEKILVPTMRNAIIREFKQLGYTYTSLDLAGYRSGSLNETLDIF